MKKQQLITTAIVLASIIGLFTFISQPVLASGGVKRWGKPLTILEYIQVGNDEEIPKGSKAYVLQSQAGFALVPTSDWERLMQGDLTLIKDKIETEIPGSKVIFIQISWTDAEPGWVIMKPFGAISAYKVTGFVIEGIVENLNAGLTGLEIIAILLICVLISVIVTAMVLGVLITLKLLSAIEQLPPLLQIPILLFLLIGVGLFVLTIILALFAPKVLVALTKGFSGLFGKKKK